MKFPFRAIFFSVSALYMYQLSAQYLFFMHIEFIYTTCFGVVCTIIRENCYAIYLKPYIVIKLLNTVSTVRTAVTL